jgi:hypothetical protein
MRLGLRADIRRAVSHRAPQFAAFLMAEQAKSGGPVMRATGAKLE